MSEVMYTKEQLDIELLKQKNDHMFSAITEIKTEMKSQFHWLMGSISVLYISIIGCMTTALGKAFGWF